jgi:hypothetical protein
LAKQGGDGGNGAGAKDRATGQTHGKPPGGQALSRAGWSVIPGFGRIAGLAKPQRTRRRSQHANGLMARRGLPYLPREQHVSLAAAAGVTNVTAYSAIF